MHDSGALRWLKRKLFDRYALAQGDAIKTIEILDSTDALFAAQKASLDKWNKVLG